MSPFNELQMDDYVLLSRCAPQCFSQNWFNRDFLLLISIKLFFDVKFKHLMTFNYNKLVCKGWKLME